MLLLLSMKLVAFFLGWFSKGTWANSSRQLYSTSFTEPYRWSIFC